MTTAHLKDSWPWSVLQLSRDSTDSDIRRQYLKLALQHHPDKATGCAQTFQAVSSAYEAARASVKAERDRAIKVECMWEARQQRWNQQEEAIRAAAAQLFERQFGKDRVRAACPQSPGYTPTFFRSSLAVSRTRPKISTARSATGTPTTTSRSAVRSTTRT